MTAPSTIEKTRPSDPILENGEPVVAHIVKKDKIAEAYIEGTPLTALCGKVWVPGHDPKGKPLCQACKDLADSVWGEGAGDGVQP